MLFFAYLLKVIGDNNQEIAKGMKSIKQRI